MVSATSTTRFLLFYWLESLSLLHYFSIGLNDLGIVNFKEMGKQIQIKRMVKTNLIQLL